MTQKPRGEYEMEIHDIGQGNMHTDGQKTNALLGVIAKILLDIREKLFNPDMKAPAEPRS